MKTETKGWITDWDISEIEHLKQKFKTTSKGEMKKKRHNILSLNIPL
jgi:hypothetical protein